MKYTTLIFFLLVFNSFFAFGQKKEDRPRIDLSGAWQFQFDDPLKGTSGNYVLTLLADQIMLPGTTDTNKKGKQNNVTTETSQLSRKYKYVGKAWYRKSVTIPKTWDKKQVTLTLERTKPTKVWVDDKLVDSNDNISTMQVYDLSAHLSPGGHHITIMVDNGQSVPKQLLSSSHAYTEATQTNWNGIIGELFLEAKDLIHIQSLSVSPDALRKRAQLTIEIANPASLRKGMQLELHAKAWNTAHSHDVAVVKVGLEKDKGTYMVEYPLGKDALLWSEFTPALYSMEAKIKGHDKQVVNFGLRDFTASGTQFAINGQPTFLRGKHDACVFPLTGHVPMDLESWQRYFRICKEYGINHVRFHSWCPPKACFDAADTLGIYLQPELPFWGGLKRNEEYLTNFLSKEGICIQQAYGDHASFVMFALGNELSGDLDLMQEFVEKFRKVDNRHLYALGSNNFLGFKGQVPGEDYLVTCRIGNGNLYEKHTRGSFSFADAPDGGILNNTYPSSSVDFSAAISSLTVPVISHETGQFQVYPNFKEVEKYTGVLRPDNFSIFRKRLEAAGMADQANDFFRASGRWAAMLYKADIEMDLRTKGFGGFQLLDIQDYPGQGSAYVGILDAFMDNKGLITSTEWKEFCNDVVPLFVTDKFCWTDTETLFGKLKIANYSNTTIKNKNLIWTLESKSGKKIDSGQILIENDSKGVLELGTIRPNISTIKNVEELLLTLALEGTDYRNRYPLWIYPNNPIVTKKKDIYVSKKMDERMMVELENGKDVLWFPQKKDYPDHTVGGLFQTDYWNFSMFKGICDRIGKPVSPGTLGILTDPKHPLFKNFPTDAHTNWQWYPIIKHSYPLIMDRLPSGYKPVVQVIDNIERNHRLGLVFEFKVGEGKLLVCMSDLDAVMDKPEARQFYNSLIQYMSSPDFNPFNKISKQSLYDLFTEDISSKEIKEVKNISYED
ncbi:beta-glycosidase [Pedobacter sp. N36a]|uniref:sugar-binding domain-containing protein n=1 Tax=Pedobacter sp. N36a TaxID=2767996 RepID=UPI0016574E5C|nr:sugar-binding domain-containing protein [Pedobacter sp. N36a]MBC8988016.1 beta-glycosidase [Pedobacter sp. N36a]